MTDIDDCRRAILDLGSEDYYHLADAATYLPNISPARRVELAREAMRQLLHEGLVQIYFGRLATNEVDSVPLMKALVVIQDSTAWNAEYPEAGTYSFANTDAGDDEYRRTWRPSSG
jgi:hypothetical protein